MRPVALAGRVLLPGAGLTTRIKGVDVGGVLAQDVVPADLLGRGQLGADRKVALQYAEAPDAFSPGDGGVRPVHSLLDGSVQVGVLGEVADGRYGGLAELLLPPGERRGVQCGERGDVGSLVADDDALADQPVLPEPVFCAVTTSGSARPP